MGTQAVLKSVFRPLHKLLAWLEEVEPGKELPALDNQTKILEFRKLSEAAWNMSTRSHQAYVEQKQFIENASHELQTPLAIARGKVELLAESETLDEKQMKELDEIYNTLGRVVKLNKSLLLLTRIENRQYTELEVVDFNRVLEDFLPDLMDIYEDKQVLFEKKETAIFVHTCNRWLAHILLSNLVKNSLVHNSVGGILRITITADCLEIANSGACSLDKEQIFRRFYHALGGKQDSTGLGLSIAHSIALSFGMTLTYRWEEGMHLFLLKK